MRLTRDETILIAGLLLTLVVGSVVRHYREQWRLEHPRRVAPTPVQP